MAGRLLRVLALFLFAFLDFIFRLQLRGRARSIHHRALWLRRWANQFRLAMAIDVTVRGRPPERGLLTANHLGYADIVVLGSLQPVVFVSKSEVANWPVVGPLTRCAGTLYIIRSQKSDVVRMGDEIMAVVEAGVAVTLFLEGTSSDGTEVLPFRSSLLAPAEARGWPATPAWIHYELEPGDGSVGEEICYWRDMTFGKHLLNLLSKRRIRAVVCFGDPVTGLADRKLLAAELHRQVCRLKDEYLSGNTVNVVGVGK